MPNAASASATIVVVDPSPSDYYRLERDARKAGIRFYHMLSGREALQVASSASVSLWIVNVNLPDISGFELVERLRPRWRGSDVFLVGDHYRSEDEIRALSLGVTLFLCKPVRSVWLSHWRPRPERVGTEEQRLHRHEAIIERPPVRRD